MAHRAGERGWRLLDPLRLTDPLFVLKFSTSVVCTVRLADKGDAFWKGSSLCFWLDLLF